MLDLAMVSLTNLKAATAVFSFVKMSDNQKKIQNQNKSKDTIGRLIMLSIVMYFYQALKKLVKL